MHDETATLVPRLMLVSAPFLSYRDVRGGSSLLRVSRRLLFRRGVGRRGRHAALPRSQPPTPQSVIGWEPCADYKLATYEQIEDYFRKLATAVPGRMKLVDMGKTAEGRTQVLAIISSEENIRQLGKYK